MKKSDLVIRNVSVIAVNNGNKEGFSIYLRFSGQQEFLTCHRHNGLLYNLLKNGVYLDTLRRARLNREIKAFALYGVVSHLLNVIDEYIIWEHGVAVSNSKSWQRVRKYNQKENYYDEQLAA